MEINKIIIGSDHAGYDLKEKIKYFLLSEGYDVVDKGTFSKDSCDYPVIAKDVARDVVEYNFYGILICGTGIGMSIASNKIKGIRAVVCSDTTSAKYSRLHNNTNVLCLGARIIGENLAKDICKIWLETKFEEGRHRKRIEMFE